MFTPIPSGSKIQIQGLKCHLPPLGWGTHCETGETAQVDIIKRSQSKKEQYWEVPKLPDELEEWKEEEEERKLLDPDYVHPELVKVKQREWHRRLYGVWFYNNGTPIYLTGTHYFYLTYWYLDTGLPDYRDIDLEYFYFWQYAVEDPKSLGIIEIRKRRDGKSYRSSCILYETISRSKESHGAIQSKNKDDAQEFFDIKLVPAFKSLPFFFKPEYDTSAGDTPREILRFFRSSKRGRGARVAESKKVPELKSTIYYKDRQAKALDGRKLKRIVLDESGKVEIDVMGRHAIVKYCLMDNRRRIIGKMIVTSTVEEIGVKHGFKKLWTHSNQHELEKHGSTKSGLYKFFIPASRSGDYDIYGAPKVDETLAAIKADREALTDDPDDLNAIMRKEPLSEKEAFMVSSGLCHFNPLALNNRIADLALMENYKERGEFLWKGGQRDTEIEWVKNPKGNWEICYLPEESNKVREYSRGKAPASGDKYICGVDPIDIDLPKDEQRASKPAAIIMKRYDIHDPNHPYSKAFVCRYLPAKRQKAASEFYEDLIKMCVYYGCPLLHENNKNRLQYYFIERGYGDFLIYLPGEKEAGINANADSKASMLELKKEYVKENIDNVFFDDLIADWLEFDIKDSTPFDLAMAAGWCIVADKRQLIKNRGGKLKDITEYFQLHKVS
jgi:hypothetical protein